MASSLSVCGLHCGSVPAHLGAFADFFLRSHCHLSIFFCLFQRDKSKRGAMCEFLESVESRGYNRYRSIANGTHFLAFNAKGKPLRYNPRLSMGYEEKCINFIKVDVMYNRTRNNSNLSGGVYSPSPEVTRRFYKDGSHLISGKHRKRHKDKRRRA